MRGGSSSGIPKLFPLKTIMPVVALVLAALWVAARVEAPARAGLPGPARVAAHDRGPKRGEHDRGHHPDDFVGTANPDDDEGPDDDGDFAPAPAESAPLTARVLPPPTRPTLGARIIAPRSPRFLDLLRIRC